MLGTIKALLPIRLCLVRHSQGPASLRPAKTGRALLCIPFTGLTARMDATAAARLRSAKAPITKPTQERGGTCERDGLPLCDPESWCGGAHRLTAASTGIDKAKFQSGERPRQPQRMELAGPGTKLQSKRILETIELLHRTLLERKG